MHTSVKRNEASTAERTYLAREVVGVFGDPNALEKAVDQLEISGFDRAAISVLGTDAKAREQVDLFYRNAREIEDSGRAPREAFASSDSKTEATAAVVGIPLYIGGIAGAAAVAATGGALALAIAATIGGAAAGAGLGTLLGGAIAHHHSANVEEQINKGGLVLWVSVVDRQAEQRAIAALEKAGARDVHFHEINRTWSLDDVPLSDFALHPDPFLASDRSARKKTQSPARSGQG